MAKKIEMLNDQQEVVHPLTSSDCVIMENGKTLEEVMGDGIATPTVTHEGASFQVGVGDSNIEVVDGDVAGMTLEGQTYQNILPKPTTLIMETDEKEFKINDKIDNNIVLDDNVAEIATIKGQTYVNVVQEESATEYTVLGEDLSGQSITTGGKPEGIIKNATLEGMTLVNTIQEPSEANSVVLDLDADINAQYATIDNTVQGGIKSAILTGQTLVNLLQNAYVSDGVMKDANVSYSKADTTYTLIYNVTALPTTSTRNTFMVNLSNGTKIYQSTSPTIQHKMGINKWVFKTPIDGTFDVIGYWSNNEDIKLCANNIVLLEGDYTQENIPYFEGMQSVKMPVLTTTGKNLFNNKIITDYIIGEKDGGYIIDCYKLYKQPYILEKPLTGTFTFTYTTKEEAGGNNPRFVFYFSDGTTLQSYNGQTSKEYETYSITINNKSITKIGATYSNLNNIKWIIKKDSIQLEQGSTATSYEPFKTNILSTSEDVTLRGIGDVQDTLDCLTGEVVQNIGEMVLDGSESWKKYRTMSDGSYNFVTNKIDKKAMAQGKIISNNLPVRTEIGKGVGLYLNRDASMLELSFNDLSTVEEVKNYLNNNNATIQYQLATKSVKTVDLSIVDQDNNSIKSIQAQPTLTHITTSSNGLIPFVSIPSQLKYPTIIKPSTTYTVQLKHTTVNSNNPLTINLGGTTMPVPSTKFTITTPKALTSQDVIFTGKNNVIGEVVITEGDTTGIEYDFFEGMNDVKSPSVKTTGKNLVVKTKKGAQNSNGGIIDSNRGLASIDLIKIKNGSTYILSGYPSPPETYAYALFDKNKNYLNMAWGELLNPIDGVSYVRPFMLYNTDMDLSDAYMQLEEGSTATSYEPYKGVTIEQDIDSIPLTSGMFEQGGYNGGSTSIVKGMSVQQFPISQRADRIKSKTLIKVKPNTTYSINDLRLSAITFDKNGGYNNIIDFCTSFTTDANTYYLGVNLSKTGNSDITPSTLDTLNLTLQEVPQEIVLRSLPNGVKDTLNLTTGEYVQRIGEVVLNGSEAWEVSAVGTNTIRYSISLKVGIEKTLLCANFNTSKDHAGYDEELISTFNGYLYIRVAKAKASNIEEFKKYLSQNQVTVQYQLATPIIHKVNLTNTTKLPSYNSTTHYDTIVPSNSLIPNITLPSTIDYNVAIKPSTQYTVRCNTTNALSVNLGGSTGTLANGKVTLTTPSTLAHNSLKLGNGKAKEVMVVEGSEIKDNVPFFNGMKNVQMGGIKLVNIARGATVDSDKIVINTNKTQFTYTSTGGSSWSSISFDVKLLKPNTLYTVYMNIVKNTLTGNASSAGGAKICLGDSGNKWLEVEATTGIYCKTMKTTNRIVQDNFGILIRPNTEGQQLIVKDFMVFEGDWTHLDEIPYIESEMIIEQPIIRSQGKNLFDGNFIVGDINTTTGNYWGGTTWKATDYIKVENKGKIVFSSSIAFATANFVIFKYDKDKKYIGYQGAYDNFTTATFNLENSVRYIKIRVPYDVPNNTNIQIEEGSTATSYEPFKQHTLSSNRVIGYEEGCYYNYSSGSRNVNSSVNSMLADVEGLSVAYVTGGSSNYTFWDKDNVFISGKQYLDTSLSSYDKNGFITVPSNAKYMRFAAGGETNTQLYRTATVTGELPLRSLPNGICDSFNLVTGEYVQRVGEIVLDGSEGWLFNTSYLYAELTLNDYSGLAENECVNNRLPQTIIYGNENSLNNNRYGLMIGKNKLIRIRMADEQSGQTSDGIKQWLQQNPITVQYELATPIVRKIGLTAKGNYKEVELNGSERVRQNPELSKKFHVYDLNLANDGQQFTLFTNKEQFTVTNSAANYTVYKYKNGADLVMIINENINTVDLFKRWLSQNPIKVSYLSTNSASSYSNIQKPIFFNNVKVQFMNNNVDIQPTLTLQARTKNSYVMDMMKANTVYTSKFLQSASGSTFIDGIAVSMKPNNTFTSPSTLTNKLMITPLNRQEFMIIEGDVTRFTIPYYKGIRSAYDSANEIEVYSVNKNLLDINNPYSKPDKVIIDKNSVRYDSGVTGTVMYYVYVREGEKYYVTHINSSESTNNSSLRFRVVNVRNGETIIQYRNGSASFVAPYTGYVSFDVNRVSANSSEITIGSFMVALNNSEHIYQPHQHNTTLIPMPTRLETVKVVRPVLENGVINTGNGANAEDTTNSYLRSDFIPVQPKEFIYFLNGNSDRVVNIICYNKDKNFMCYLYNSNDYVPENCYFVRIYMGKANTSDLTMTRMAYKPIALNSLPNGVKDEIIIDPVSNKAKLIQRVGKVVLDGSETWELRGGGTKYSYTIVNLFDGNNCQGICDKFTFISSGSNNSQSTESICSAPTTNALSFFTNNDNLSNINSLKLYLQQNPITVYYSLATPITHEVRLTGFPFVYEDGSVQLNTELPHKTLVDYNVNQEQLINNQNETIIRHDKQIDSLYDYIELYLEEEYRMELFRMQLELSL